MSTRLRVIGTKGTKSLNVLQYMDARDRERLSKRAAKLVDDRVRQKIQQHYLNAVQAVGAALSGVGMSPSITTSGSKRISFLRAEGGSGYINTGTWERLSRLYLEEELRPNHWTPKEKGTGFWHNSGALADAFLDQVIEGGVKVRKGRSKVEPASRAGRVRMVTTWKLEPLGDPYADALIRGPFATSSETARGSVTIDVSGDMWKLMMQEDGRRSVGWFPYNGRPWVARLSATLGKQMRTAVRKLA